MSQSVLIKLMNSFSNAGNVVLNKFNEVIFSIDYKERVWNFKKINYEETLEFDDIEQAPKKYTMLDKRTHETYFLYVEDEETIKYKVLEWLSRPAFKEGVESTQKWYLDGINAFLGTNLSEEDIKQIYCRLGNNVNRNLCIEFVKSNYNMEVLK